MHPCPATLRSNNTAAAEIQTGFMVSFDSTKWNCCYFMFLQNFSCLQNFRMLKYHNNWYWFWTCPVSSALIVMWWHVMLTASVDRVWLRICNNVYDVVRCLMSPLTDRPQVIIHLSTVFRFVSMWNLMSSHLHQLSVLFCQSMSNLPHPLIDAQKHDTQQNQNVKLGSWLLLCDWHPVYCWHSNFLFYCR